jgi:hypothetical protein
MSNENTAPSIRDLYSDVKMNSKIAPIHQVEMMYKVGNKNSMSARINLETTDEKYNTRTRKIKVAVFDKHSALYEQQQFNAVKFAGQFFDIMCLQVTSKSSLGPLLDSIEIHCTRLNSLAISKIRLPADLFHQKKNVIL